MFCQIQQEYTLCRGAKKLHPWAALHSYHGDVSAIKIARHQGDVTAEGDVDLTSVMSG